MTRYIPLVIEPRYASQWLRVKGWNEVSDPLFPFMPVLWQNDKYQGKTLKDAIELQMMSEFSN